MRCLPFLGIATLLVACNQSTDSPVDSQVFEQPAGTGGFLLTESDGSQSIGYLASDGRYYSTNSVTLTGRWEATDEGVCFANDDGTNVCAVPGTFDENGVQVPVLDNGDQIKVIRLDKPGVANQVDVIEPRAETAILENGDQDLSIWMPDGRFYVGMLDGRGAWDIEGARICFTPDEGEKGCDKNDPPSDDGTWMSTRPNGDRYKVERIL